MGWSWRAILGGGAALCEIPPQLNFIRQVATALEHTHEGLASRFVVMRMAQEAARGQHDRNWVAVAGGMHLFDSMGSVVVLRPDGSVWFCDDPDEADSETWRWLSGWTHVRHTHSRSER